MSDTALTVEKSEYERMQQTPEFQGLRRRFRNFVFPMTALFLVWYFLYVLLANYAYGFMNIHVFGNLSMGFVLAFGQFVSTFAITMIYARWANKRLDPQADAIRRELEGDQQ